MKNNYRSSDEDLDLFKSKTFEKISYPDQLKYKQEKVNALFGEATNPIIVNPKPKHYRHKAVLSAVNQKDAKGKYQLKLGLYEEGSKKITPTLGHFIHDPAIDELFKQIYQVLVKYKILAYHPNDRKGVLKHVLIRKSFASKELMVVFVTMGNLLPNYRLIVKDIIALNPKVTTILQNIHDKETPLVLLDNFKILYGSGNLFDKINDLTFKISAKAFYQVNPLVMQTLYNEALKAAEITKQDLVLDAYCGIGTITLLAAQYAKQVIGVDINKVSISDANANKKLNQVSNVSFVASDVNEFIKNFNEKIDVLIMDPAREGSTPEFMDAVKNLNPRKIVYISCNPNTQKRDLRLIKDQYIIEKVMPVDMFSYTAHVENIVILKVKSKPIIKTQRVNKGR
jgi:23S rRNA (uracil1939-C5)-methyltransferase